MKISLVPSSTRRRLRTAAVTALLAATTVATGGIAHAESNPTIDLNSNGDDTTLSMEKCAEHSEDFRFRFYYSPDYKGAWVNVGHNIYDMKSIDVTAAPDRALYFCDNGAGGGQQAANNAASAYNWYEGYEATIFYSLGYRGAWDTVRPRSGISLLPNTRNNNRSINFRRG
ncbi:hypothetical protein [Streptomyces sp. NPDC089919]|uniref:hypothetical protein n=1 Tax=Streptomyces sp. NPDC089919 TaxID=3155188 RepID=UPI003419FB4E